jgi:hypothetical protein
MLTRIGSAFVLLAALVAIGCQSKDENGQDQYTLLDDMEGRDGSLEFRWGNGCMGEWRPSVGVDESDKDKVWTLIFDTLSPSHQTLRGTWSTRAAHLYTIQPLTATETDLLADAGTTAPSADAAPPARPWGANMNIDLTRQSDTCSARLDAGATGPLPADLSAYSGLVFWAKASSLDGGVGEQTIHVMVHDQISDPRANVCNVSGLHKNETDCFNGFSLPLDLSNTFTRYEVDFSKLQQDPTWGYLSPTNALDSTRVYQILFEVRTPKCVVDRNARCMAGDPQTLQFDFWIDDLYLVKHSGKQ